MRKFQVIENPMTRPIPFKRPAPPVPVGLTCGCGKPADYELYDSRDPHCRSCMLDAVDNETFVMVRRIGGFDDAS